MRLIVFFDLPSVYSIEKRRYNKFRKSLINEGFIMEQESVYSKLLLNSQQIGFITSKVEKACPKNGIVQLLIITERQYSQMKFIVGNTQSKVISNEERLLIL